MGALSGPRAGQRGNVHQAVLYDSEEDLLGTVVPFLREGVRAGEPTVVVAGQMAEALLRGALPEADQLVFLDRREHPRPSSTITAFRELFAGYVAAGASGIRLVGQLAPATLAASWWWWARYEAARNHVYDEFPLASMCLYDTRSTPRHVVGDVLATHPQLATVHGQRPSEGYRPTTEFLAGHAPMPDPLEAGAPLIDLVDAPLADARHAVWDADRAGRLAASVDVEAVVLMVNEALTNAARHGLLPARFRLWAGADRVVVAVGDHGPGPADPLAGLLPARHALAGEPGRNSQGGQGLWLIHELADHVTLDQHPEGYTLRATLAHRDSPSRPAGSA